MSRTSIDTTGMASGEGEIVSATDTGIVIVGDFSPGETICGELRPGRRVAVFNEDALREWDEMPHEFCPYCDDKQDEIDSLQVELRTAETRIKALEKKQA